MNSSISSQSRGFGWKIPVITLVHFVAALVSGGIIAATGMPWPEMPEPMTMTENLAYSFVGSILVAICLAVIARGIGGSRIGRWLVLSVFTYVTLTLNTQIEAHVFTTFGGTATMLLFDLLPAFLGAAAAVAIFSPPDENLSPGTVFDHGGIGSWGWRVIAAWLAFPVIYFFFGLLAAPIVVPVYQADGFGLILPGLGTMVPVSLLRSALYLAAALPILRLWAGTRKALLISLGIALVGYMGAIGLLTSTFFPPVLRIAHGLEVLGDAVVYAWLLVALFIPKPRLADNPTVAVTAE